jgi:hypothetical protein
MIGVRKFLEKNLKLLTKTAHNSGFCNIGAEAIPISNSSLLGFGSGRSFSIIFCTLFVHLFFNWAAVPGGRISNPPTSQSPTVICNQFGKSVTFIGCEFLKFIIGGHLILFDILKLFYDLH